MTCLDSAVFHVCVCLRLYPFSTASVLPMCLIVGAFPTLLDGMAALSSGGGHKARMRIRMLREKNVGDTSKHVHDEMITSECVLRRDAQPARRIIVFDCLRPLPAATGRRY